MKNHTRNKFFLLLAALSCLLTVFLPVTAEEKDSSEDTKEIRISTGGTTENLELKVKGIPEESSESYKSMISEQYTTSFTLGEVYAAVDITFLDKAGNTIKPKTDVDVTISNLSIPEGKKAAVFHIDEKEAERIESQNDTDSVSFKTNQTGIFLIVEANSKHHTITGFREWKEEDGVYADGGRGRITVEYSDPTAEKIVNDLPQKVYGYVNGSKEYQSIPVSAWTHNYTDGETGLFLFTAEVDKDTYTVSESIEMPLLEVAVNRPYSYSSTKARASLKKISPKAPSKSTSAREEILGGSYKKTTELTDADKEDDYQKNYQSAADSDENNFLLKSAEWESIDDGEAVITVTGQRNDIPRVVYVFITCQSHGFKKSIAKRNIQQLLSKYPIVDVIAIDGPNEWGANAAAGGQVCGIEPVMTFTADNASEISDWVDGIYWRYGNHYTMNIPAALRKYLFGSINGEISEDSMIRHPSAIFVSMDFLYDNANYGDGTGHPANQPYGDSVNDAYDSSGMLWKYATKEFFQFITDHYITGTRRYYSMSDVAKGSSGKMAIYGATYGKESSDDQRLKIIEAVANPDKYGQTPCGSWSTDSYTTTVNLTGTPSDFDYSNDFSSANVPMPEGIVDLTDTVSDRYTITSVEAYASDSAVTVKGTVDGNKASASSSNYQPGTEVTMKIHVKLKDTESYFESFEDTNTGNALLTSAGTTVMTVSSPKLSRFKPKLTVQYLEKGTEKVLAEEYNERYKPGETYSVPSPDVSGYFLDDEAQKTVSGTMPKKNLLIKVYYVKPLPPVKAVTNDGGNDINEKLVRDGDTLHYSISFTNPSSSAKTFTITDQIPEIAEFVSVENGGKLEGNIIIWTGSADGGTSTTVKWTARAKGKGVTITNKANVKMDDISQDTNNVTNWTPEEPIKHVLDESGKDIDKKMRISGQELIYTLTFKNPYDHGTEAAVTDVLPDEVEYVSSTDDGVLSDSTVTWTVSMNAKEEKTVSVTVRILDTAKDMILKNKAKVRFDEIELETNEVENPVLPDPVKEVQDDEGNDIHQLLVNEGDQLHYFITFKNPADEKKFFTITDTLPEHTSFISADHEGQLAASDTGEGAPMVQWQIEMEPHQEETVGFIVKTVGTGTYIPNTGNVAVDDVSLDTNIMENWVPEDPVKKVSDENGNDANYTVLYAQDSRVLTYSIEVNNNSTLEKEYTVTDDLDKKLVFRSADHEGSYDAEVHMITWRLSLPPNTKETVSFIAEPDNTSTGTKIENGVDVSADKYKNKSNIVVNYLEDLPEKITVEGKKDWEMNGIEAVLPDHITIRLLADDEEVRSERITPDTDGSWSFLFTNVPKYMYGREVEYTVSEDPVEGYQTVIEGDHREGFTVTNTKDPLPEKKVLDSEGTDINEKIVRTGDVLTYTVTYINPFDVEKEYTVTDKLPKGLKFISADNDGTFKDGIVTWVIITPAGKEQTVSVNAEVTDEAFDVLRNKALVGVDDQKIVTNEVENPVMPDPVKDVLNSEGISINYKEVMIGDELTYTITFRNPYDHEADITVTDDLPEGLEYISSSDEGSCSDSTVTWEIPMSASEEKTVTVTVKVAVTASETLVNTALVTIDNLEIETNEVHNPVIKEPVKQVLDSSGKDIDGETVKPGDRLTYAVTFENPYDRDMQYTVTDQIPAGLKFISTDNNGKEESGIVTWEIELKEYEKKTVSFVVEVLKTDYQSFINSADVHIGSLTLKTNEVKNLMDYEPELKPVKDVLNDSKQSINGKEVKPGELVTYTITFTNPYDIDHVFTVMDILPEEVEYVSADQGATALSYHKTTKVIWNITVPANQKATVSTVARVKNPKKEVTFKNTGTVILNEKEYQTNEVKNSAKHSENCCTAEPTPSPSPDTNEASQTSASPAFSNQGRYIRNLPYTGDTSNLLGYGMIFPPALVTAGYALYRLRKSYK